MRNTLRPLIVLIGCLVTTTSIFGQVNQTVDQTIRRTLTEQDFKRICQLDHLDLDAFKYYSSDEFRQKGKTLVRTASIEADYIGGWPQEAVTAFEYAMDIWESHIDSPIPIRVVAQWNTDLATNTLGSAGPSQFIQIFASGGATWYPIALASAVNEVDYVQESQGTADQVDYDISVNMNANFPAWYFGTDGQTPAGTYDFVTVVLHEVAHGLGFTGSVRESGGNVAEWGYGAPVVPFVYDRFVVDGNGNEVLNSSVYGNPSIELHNAVTGDANGIYFAGLQSIGNYEGFPVPLYAPNTWAQGSSFSHLDYEPFTGTPNALMRHQINSALAVHSPGPVVCTMFGDMGWPLGQDCEDVSGTNSQISLNNVENNELDFGVTNEGETVSSSVSISNRMEADGPLVARVSLSGRAYRLNNQSQFIVLQPGEEYDVPISFVPARAGKLAEELTINHNSQAIENPITVQLQGEALAQNETFIVEQNYPNPFNSSTQIPYALSQSANVKIDVYDALGKHIQTLIDGEQAPGRYNQAFRANKLSSGLYLYRIIVDGESETRKLLYTK